MAKNISNISNGLNDYLKNNIKNSTFNDLQTDYKTIIDAINELANPESLFADYQLKNDSNLETNDKTVVGAINELFQNGNSVKQKLVDALIAKNVTDVSTSDTFEILLQRLMELDNCPIQAFEYTFNVPAWTTISLQPSRVLLMSTNKTDWGDGTKDTSTSHTYVDAGVYKVKTPYSVVSAINNYSRNTVNSLTDAKIINLDNYRDADYIFYNCRNLTGSPACGNNVTTMRNAYRECYNLTGSPVCGPNVTNMYSTYMECYNLTGSPVCGNSVVNFGYAYSGCSNLTGNPVCGENVEYFRSAYYDCYKLTGQPVCGPNVTDMTMAYQDCSNLSGAAACGDNVINMEWAYRSSGITGPAACGNSVINMYEAYYECTSLKGNAASGPSVVNMYSAYENCRGLNGAAACGDNVRDFSRTYKNCHSLVGPAACGNSITNMFYTYQNCFNLTGTAACGPNVIDMPYTYSNCNSLITAACGPNVKYMNTTYCNCTNLMTAACGPNVISMEWAYSNCTSLTTAACGPNVTNMYYTYYNCTNLTTAVCGPNVINMASAYQNCKSLTGAPACGANVSSMAYAYWNCSNLTTAVCGPNVKYVNYAYYNCIGLTGSPVCGPNVTNMAFTYYNCYNLTGDMYILSDNVSNITNCFNSRNTSNKLYIYVNKNTTSLNSCLVNNSKSLVGSTITWTNTNRYHYDPQSNIYIRPVDNVAELEAKHKYKIVTYSFSSNEIFPEINEGAYTNYNYETTSENEITIYKNNIEDEITQINFKNKSSLEYVDYMINSVTNMMNTYMNCSSLKEIPPCGEKVTKMRYTYSNCYNLTGSPVCGLNVTDMHSTYYNCRNLTGSPVCGNKVTNMSNTYYNCINLTGSPVCGPNVTNMYGTYMDCYNLTGSPVCGNSVVDMMNAYRNCTNLTGNPVCGPNVNSMLYTYADCYNLTGSPVCGNNVIRMYYAYYNCYNLTGSPACGNNVINMANAYCGCNNLTGSPVCGPNVTDMANAYRNCYKLTGNPVCGDKVVEMYNAYYGCTNLTGSPVCGPNVDTMHSTYMNCFNLTGNPACGENVTNMYQAYANCYNLTGSPVCGNRVANMAYAYYYCNNLTGPSILVGSNVTNMRFAYWNTRKNNNTYKNAYILSPSVSNAQGVFGNSINSIRLNIYVQKNSTTLNTFLLASSGKSITNSAISWTNAMATSECYYNTYSNVYIYPVTNVAQYYNENENGANGKTSYTVTNVSTNGGYGFTLASDGYYESGNTNINSSFAMCRVDFENPKGLPIRIYVQQDTELYSDFGFISNINTTFVDSYTYDGGYYASFEGADSGDIGYGDYTSGFFYIKYVKDSSSSSGNDKFRFKIVFLGAEDEGNKNTSWDVERIDGVTYGFSLNSDEYWESENKGADSTAALCKVIINNPDGYAVFFDCINYAEGSWDFGLLSKVGDTLSTSSSTDGSSLVFKSFSGSSSSSVQTVAYGGVSGVIYVKYKKDGSVASGNDTLQFKVRFGDTPGVAPASGAYSDSYLETSSYTVETVSGTNNYGFTYNNSTGYYVSGNKGIQSSYALCNVKINNPSGKNVIFDCINYGEANYDYGLLSNVNTTLTANYSADTTNVFFNFYGKSNSAVQTVNYGAINGFVHVKYKKDYSQDSYNDTLQFKVRFE